MSLTFQHRNLPHLLLSARETLMQRFRPILKDAGITEPQWRVLRTLYDAKEIDATTLAQAAQILAPSLTRMLRILERSDMIIRNADARDMRRQAIKLSEHGRRTMADLGPRIEKAYQELEACIGSELLDDMYGNIDAMMQRIAHSERPGDA